MIGTIRKHSKWLWWFIAGITIISFVFFMGSGPARNRGGAGGDGNYGTIYNHVVTDLEYQQAQKDFELYYLLNEGTWPEKAHVSDLDEEKQIYGNLMLAEKAKTLGVSVSEAEAANSAANVLASPVLSRAVGNRTGKPLTMDQFEELIKSHELTAADFEHYVRTRMMIEQMQLAMGLSGSLITPREASAVYDQEHATVSTEALFFSASNYLDQVHATPAAVAGFFTNYMADYREPDRVQVNYVWFNITNYIEQSKAEWAKTNFDQVVNDDYNHMDPSQMADAKTPEAAKAKIRDILIKQRAYADVSKVAEDFLTTLYANTNFPAAAKQLGVVMRTSAPFSVEGDDEDFANAPDVAKTAFTLTSDSPYSGAIPGGDGIYVIGLAAQLPSAMPAFADIQPRVVRDYETIQATTLARTAGTNFWLASSIQVSTGKTLAQIAVAKGLSTVMPAPFSLSSSDIPEIGDLVDVDTFKQVAFHVAPGHVSPLISTRDGGFVLYVKSISPPDAATKAAELPEYTQQLRRQREGEAFQLWANTEASHVFPGIPALQKAQAAAQAQQPAQ